eukprot:c17901_g1_i1.p1 GENE.c17901_g1_i1~~c17901_g1_i1.p1  ORF type:complete len:478 (+),score=109.63 c17901_g1_i1:154-1434(+)
MLERETGQNEGLFVPAQDFRQNTQMLTESDLSRQQQASSISAPERGAVFDHLLFPPHHPHHSSQHKLARPQLASLWEGVPTSPPLSCSPPPSQPAHPSQPAESAQSHHQHHRQHILHQRLPPSKIDRTPVPSITLTPSPQSVMPISPTARGRFEWEIPAEDILLDSLLGEGAFGRVFRGTWHGTPIAAKVLTVQHLTEKHIDDFVCEVTVLSKMRHPNILLFLGAATVTPHLCIVTELMSKSLFHVVHDPTVQLPIRVVVGLMLGVACGMNYLHSFRPPLLHRDLKSANLLVDESVRIIKVADFGLARTRERSGAMTAQRGTFQWMAPEMIMGKTYGEAADVYSFAIIMWECVARKLPFEGSNGITAAMAVCHSHLRPETPPNCHAAYRDLMHRCWHSNPEFRPSFSEIISELRSIEQSLLESGFT